MPKKYYAVKEGFDFNKNEAVKDLILDSWDECVKYVKGVKGAKYKSFKSKEEASNYLSDNKENVKKGTGEYPKDCLHIYVDGSYSVESERYAFAFVAVRDEVIVHVENGSSRDNSKKQLRQIAGELEAAARAVAYAHEMGEKKVAIFHDYAGIYHHAAGTWERKDVSSKEYFDTMNSFVKEKGMDIVFVKTDGHSGDIYNELADSFAKIAIGISLNKAVDKYLKDNRLKVKNEEIWEKLKNVVKFSNRGNVLITTEEL